MQLPELITRTISSGKSTAIAIAEQADCSRQTVYAVAKREKDPSLALATRLAQACGGEIKLICKKTSAKKAK
jgi:DNA-binding XRE family transcriptional regulator